MTTSNTSRWPWNQWNVVSSFSHSTGRERMYLSLTRLSTFGAYIFFSLWMHSRYIQYEAIDKASGFRYWALKLLMCAESARSRFCWFNWWKHYFSSTVRWCRFNFSPLGCTAASATSPGACASTNHHHHCFLFQNLIKHFSDTLMQKIFF